MNEVEKIRDGVLISSAVAAELAAVMKGFEQELIRLNRGSRLIPRVIALRDTLRDAVSDVSTDVDVRTQEGEWDWLAVSEYDLGTVEAARLLGCTPANVRDLVRRSKLPARRSGGRLLLAADDVNARLYERNKLR